MLPIHPSPSFSHIKLAHPLNPSGNPPHLYFWSDKCHLLLNIRDWKIISRSVPLVLGFPQCRWCRVTPAGWCQSWLFPVHGWRSNGLQPSVGHLQGLSEGGRSVSSEAETRQQIGQEGRRVYLQTEDDCWQQGRININKNKKEGRIFIRSISLLCQVFLCCGSTNSAWCTIYTQFKMWINNNKQLTSTLFSVFQNTVIFWTALHTVLSI